MSCESCGRVLADEPYCPYCGQANAAATPRPRHRFCDSCGAPQEPPPVADPQQWVALGESIDGAIRALPDLGFVALWVDGGGERPVNDGASHQVEIRRVGPELELRATGNRQVLPGLRFDEALTVGWSQPDEPGRRMQYGPLPADEAGIEEAVAAVMRLLRACFRASTPDDVYVESDVAGATVGFDPQRVLAEAEVSLPTVDQDLVVAPDASALIAAVLTDGGRLIADDGNTAIVERATPAGSEILTVSKDGASPAISVTWTADSVGEPASVARACHQVQESLQRAGEPFQIHVETRFGGACFEGVTARRLVSPGEDVGTVLSHVLALSDSYFTAPRLATMGVTRGLGGSAASSGQTP